MRRPLENLAPAKAENNEHLYRMLEGMMLPNPKDRWSFRLSVMFQNLVLGPINLVMRKSHESCVQFNSKESLFYRLGLEDLESRLQSGKVIYIPENPPKGEHQISHRHFPQMGVVWEYQYKGGKRLQTLQLEIGAGLRLISLEFCPLASDSFGDALQLDVLKVNHGHDEYEVNVNDPKNQPVIGSILSNVQLMIVKFLNGQNQIESLLADVVDGVIRLQPRENNNCNDMNITLE